MDRLTSILPENMRALIVDEHDIIRKSIAKALRNLGISEIYECSNGKDAKNAIDNQSFDLVISELDLNYISGFDLLDHVRSQDTGSDTPFVVVTGHTDKDFIVKAAHKGAEEFIVKPFTADEIELKISKVLTQHYSPGPLLALIRQVEKLIIEGDLKNAETILNDLLKNKEGPRARHLEAVLLLKQQRNADAATLLLANSEAYPFFLNNYVTLSNIFIDAKDYENAISALSKELELNPKQPLRQVKLANLLLKTNEPRKAIEHYRLCLLENAKHPEALYGMGTAYAMLDNSNKSIYYFKRYRRQQPKDARSLKAIVKYSEKSQQLKQAEIVLIDEIRKHPERMDTYLILAEFYFKHGQEQLAISTLESAIKKKPDFTGAHVAMAQYYLKQKDDKSAILVFQRFANISKDSTAYLYLAQLYMQLKKPEEAIVTLHQGMEARLDLTKAFPLLLMANYKNKQFLRTYFIRERVRQLDNDALAGKLLLDIDTSLTSILNKRTNHQKAS